MPLRKNLLLLLGISALGLPVAGLLYQAIASAIDARKYPPPGQLVEVGGHRLHLYCMGKKTDKPTVILEGGLPATCLDWCKVQPEIARFTQVCSYDRAGFGWSDYVAGRRTGQQIVKDLHTLLANAGIPGPYILVGHSFGGLYTRYFAATYPGDVAGLVLVDSTPEDLHQQMPELAKENRTLQVTMTAMAYLAPFGIPRMFLQAGQTPINKLSYPPEVLPVVKALYARPRFFKANSNELAGFDATIVQVRESRRKAMFGSLPLVVLTQRPETEYGDEHAAGIWHTLQKELLNLSSNSRQIIAERSGHYIQLEQPELVIDAITSML